MALNFSVFRDRDTTFKWTTAGAIDVAVTGTAKTSQALELGGGEKNEVGVVQPTNLYHKGILTVEFVVDTDSNGVADDEALEMTISHADTKTGTYADVYALEWKATVLEDAVVFHAPILPVDIKRWIKLKLQVSAGATKAIDFKRVSIVAGWA